MVAMRAIMKKISPSPLNKRLMYGLQRIPRWCSGVKDGVDVKVGCDLESKVKDARSTFYEWVKEVQSFRRDDDDINKRWMKWVCSTNKLWMEKYEEEQRAESFRRFDDINKRWKEWVDSANKLWMEKNEEEHRAELDMRWAYLRDLLRRQGIDTSNHGLLLSMKKIIPADDVFEVRCSERLGGTFEFIVGSPDRGLVSINRLVLDRGLPVLPRQSVNGLLCITTDRNDAFLIYNPITGEKSPWIDIEIDKKQMKKHNRIAFGFNPQSEEHRVIWISGSKDHIYESILERPKDQVVHVLTVGKNTWRRIDATPPISIADEDPFYVDGCLYWRFRDTEEEDELEQIMRFDIATEKFRLIPIPDFVVHPREYKYSQTVNLTQIDGRIAVLTQVSLWTFQEEADGNIKWSEERIRIPCDWDGKLGLSIEALAGANLIFLRTELSDSVFYFNRDTKKYIRFPISPNCEPHDHERTIQV